MRRRTFDALVSTAGLVLAAVLLVAGGLLMWGHSFVDGQVSTQLSAQKIVFPANNSPAIKAPEFAAMRQFAGQLMTNGDRRERVAQPAGQPGRVSGQVDVVAVEDAQRGQQLIGAGIQPVHLLAAGPAGIGQHVRVAPVGLGLTGIQIRGPAHHQARNIRHRHSPPGRERQRELGDRAGLVDHQARRPMRGGAVQQGFQVRLIVGDSAGEQPLPVVIQDISEVLLLADV